MIIYSLLMVNRFVYYEVHLHEHHDMEVSTSRYPQAMPRSRLAHFQEHVVWPLTKGQIPAIQRQSASHKEIIEMLATCLKHSAAFKTGDEASQLKSIEGK